jgi:hypothetical protein
MSFLIMILSPSYRHLEARSGGGNSFSTQQTNAHQHEKEVPPLRLAPLGMTARWDVR